MLIKILFAKCPVFKNRCLGARYITSFVFRLPHDDDNTAGTYGRSKVNIQCQYKKWNPFGILVSVLIYFILKIDNSLEDEFMDRYLILKSFPKLNCYIIAAYIKELMPVLMMSLFCQC